MNSAKQKKKTDLRADSARVLFHILEEGRSARDCLPLIQQSHKEQDKAWIQEMSYGVLRNLPLLQHWLRQLLDKPLKNRFKVIEHLIMLGFYQLAFTRVSQHAAVSETVNATQSLGAPGMKGLVNAILRNFVRQSLADNLPEDEQIQSGLPKWLFKKLIREYGSNHANLISSIKAKAPIWLRVNIQRIEFEAFCQALSDAEIDYETSATHPQGIILTKSVDITRLPGFEQGWFAVQDGAAQLAATYLQADKGERVLDCCAAPGGKTCHILELQPELEKIIALDVDATRLKRVDENLTRLGHKAVIVEGDAISPQDWWDGKQFDRILLDVPCSATGVIRRHPDIKWLRKANDINTLVQLQSNILDAIWAILKPGGTLLYATCSILPEENYQQISSFLLRQADAKLDTAFENDSESKPGRQILPGEQQMDGFYYARLLKSDR